MKEKEYTPEAIRCVSKYLRKYGVHPKHIGYHLLRESILMTMNDWSYLDGITKRLYPEIAKEFGISRVAVERDIRNAIMWAGDTLVKSGFEEIPSNREFIAIVADKVYLDLL